MQILQIISGNRLLVILIFLCGLFLRLNFVLNDDTPLEKDAAGYDLSAVNLLEGKGFINEEGQPTLFRTPGYPVFLFLIYKLFGHSYLAVKIIQALLSAFCLFFIYLIAAAFFDDKVGLVAMFMASLYQPFYAFNFGPAILVSETLYVFTFLASIYYLSRFLNKKKNIYIVLSGIFLGICTLVRPTAAWFFFIPLFWFFIKKTPLKRFVLTCGLFLVSISIIVFPWITRNYLIFGKFGQLSSGGGASFFSSNYSSDGLPGETWRKIGLPLDKKLEEIGINEVRRSQYLERLAIKKLTSEPKRTVLLFIRKLFLFWDPSIEKAMNLKRAKVNIQGIEYNYSYGFILPLAIIGILLSLKKPDKGLLLLILAILYFTLLHVVIAALIRYRIIIEPFLLIFASYTLFYFWKILSRKYIFLISIAFYVIAHMFIFYNYDRILLAIKYILRPFKLG